ncbi:MAG: hypothetical protein IT424_07485 [Pirellulales bacterium]|nr:hypothetical protein [Pirellulales bacterium]
MGPTASPVEGARQGLCWLAEGMAGDVQAHAAVVGAASRELTPICQSRSEQQQPIKEAAIKTVAANMKLQRRLEEAERKIRTHIGELRAPR